MSKPYEYGIEKEYTPDEVQSIGGVSALGNEKNVVTLYVVKGADGTAPEQHVCSLIKHDIFL